MKFLDSAVFKTESEPILSFLHTPCYNKHQKHNKDRKKLRNILWNSCSCMHRSKQGM